MFIASNCSTISARLSRMEIALRALYSAASSNLTNKSICSSVSNLSASDWSILVKGEISSVLANGVDKAATGELSKIIRSTMTARGLTVSILLIFLNPTMCPSLLDFSGNQSSCDSDIVVNHIGDSLGFDNLNRDFLVLQCSRASFSDDLQRLVCENL